MAAEQVLRLFDSFWFETTILTTKTPSNLHPSHDPNPISHTKVEKLVLPLDKKKPLLVPSPSLEVRSYSDQTLDSTNCVFCDSSSPISVLLTPKLRPIPSGREIREFIGNKEEEDVNIRKKQKEYYGHGRIRLKKERTSRSLSELEFKELKGFMDLGFVFSEEDKDSKLVSLIPGLQRLGREDAGEKGDDEESVVSHEPYLSEAWGVLYQKKVTNPLLNWRIPARGDEIDIKDNLRFWAHTVASIVR
ncbi:hypothetical protein RJT34_30191 [Clitoria ternatea]|uniref:DUF1685 domain-containing protein n=1 Tax=Clitoria ternatea TaxID=43366 RepID=A0AAN9I745_CLITE